MMLRRTTHVIAFGMMLGFLFVLGFVATEHTFNGQHPDYDVHIAVVGVVCATAWVFGYCAAEAGRKP